MASDEQEQTSNAHHDDYEGFKLIFCDIPSSFRLTDNEW